MRTLTALAAASLLAATLQAESSSATIQVSAYVIGRTLVSVQSAPAVVVTAADVERGWVDVADPALITVRSNQRAGFRLAFAPTRTWVTRAEATGLAEPLSCGPAGGSAAFSYEGTAPRQLELRWRLFLSEDAIPGTYPLPIDVATLN